jgi:lysine-specific demethylase/histidyl-hydroxylase NO66
MPDEPGAAAFRELLQPCTLEDFLGGPYGRLPWHGPAPAASRRALIGWDAVNQALASTRAWDERTLRLALRGRLVPAPEYCVPQEGASGTVWRPSPERVLGALQAGATLVASGIDGVIPAVGDLAHAIEQALPVRVQANLYLSSAGRAGFPRHDDTHDVLVLHLAGRKRWQVHAPPGPGAGRATAEAARPSEGAPLDAAQAWTLAPGDLLYLPQGWPHEALAETDGCLHLSFALVHLSLDDVARVLAQRLAAAGDAGRPLHDLHRGPAAMAAHVDEILRRLQALRDGDGFAASLLHGLLASRRPRARYTLPAVAGVVPADRPEPQAPLPPARGRPGGAAS